MRILCVTIWNIFLTAAFLYLVAFCYWSPWWLLVPAVSALSDKLL